MSDFVQEDNNSTNSSIKEEQMNICVVGIRNSNPYDTSKFTNNETTFYTEIKYNQLPLFIDIVESLKSNSSENTYTNNKTISIDLMFLTNSFLNPSIKFIFRFLCSPDCKDGSEFIDTVTTKKVYEFVKFVLQRNCIVEISDHSMASFFNNWDDEIMQMSKPIEILKFTHEGPFKMIADKNTLINSVHPTLIQIGNISSTEQIEITFNNIFGTKVYNVINPDVKLISNGRQIISNNQLGCNNINDENSKMYSEVPVHCEFNYLNGIIVVSSTHWCNLDTVETPVDLPTLRRYCSETLGDEATLVFDASLLSSQTEDDYKKVISNAVRQISSGSNVK
jgi:hypothetical protein